MKKIVFILGLALVVVSVLLFRSCQSKPDAIVSERDNKKDSIIDHLRKDSVKDHAHIDSVESDNVMIEIKYDSVVTDNNRTRSDLHHSGNKIQTIIDQYNEAKLERDSALALTKCDSLVGQVTGAKALLFLYENQTDSLRNLLTHMLSNKDTIINRLSGLNNETNNSLFQVSRLYNLQSSDLKKVTRDANKRFGIGPVVGGGIADNKIVPFVGIGISYNLFKF